MKIFLLALICLNLKLAAQSDSKWNFGLSAGLNTSWVGSKGNSGSISTKPGFSPSGGVNALYLMNSKFSIQSSLNFQSSKCQWVSGQSFGGEIISQSRFTLTNRYLNVPLVFNYVPIQNQKIALSLGAGSTFQFKLSNQLAGEMTRSFYNEISGEVNVTKAFGPEISFTRDTDFVLISPTVQAALDLKLKGAQLVRFVVSYSTSLNEPLPSDRESQRELNFNYGFALGKNNLQTISLTTQYFWRGLHPNR